MSETEKEGSCSVSPAITELIISMAPTSVLSAKFSYLSDLKGLSVFRNPGEYDRSA